MALKKGLTIRELERASRRVARMTARSGNPPHVRFSFLVKKFHLLPRAVPSNDIPQTVRVILRGGVSYLFRFVIFLR